MFRSVLTRTVRSLRPSRSTASSRDLRSQFLIALTMLVVFTLPGPGTGAVPGSARDVVNHVLQVLLGLCAVWFGLALWARRNRADAAESSSR